MNARSTFALRATLPALGLLVALVTIPGTWVPQARAGQIELLNRGKGVPSQLQPETRATRDATLRQVTGDLDYRQNTGLRVGGTRVRIDHRTATYPDDGSRIPDPSDLDGRRVTIFGRMIGDTLHASLVIFERAVQAGSAKSRLNLGLDKSPSAQAYIRPSNSDPNVGEIAPNIPD